MSVDTTFLERCLDTLERALSELRCSDPNDVAYDVYRAACVKEFEIILEQSGKLLRKRLGAYFANSRQVDRLIFKDLFRHATKHGLINVAACERWFQYHDHCNDTAHDYGKDFAEATLKLLPDFIADARALARIAREGSDD